MAWRQNDFTTQDYIYMFPNIYTTIQPFTILKLSIKIELFDIAESDPREAKGLEKEKKGNIFSNS